MPQRRYPDGNTIPASRCAEGLGARWHVTQRGREALAAWQDFHPTEAPEDDGEAEEVLRQAQEEVS